MSNPGSFLEVPHCTADRTGKRHVIQVERSGPSRDPSKWAFFQVHLLQFRFASNIKCRKFSVKTFPDVFAVIDVDSSTFTADHVFVLLEIKNPGRKVFEGMNEDKISF